MTEAIEKDTLLLLNRIGVQDRSELYSTVDGLDKNVIARLESFGYIKRDRDNNELFQITNSGIRKLGIEPAKGVAGVRKVEHVGNYDGAELMPYTGRPGSQAAMSLPSRLPDGLHYPGGRFVSNKEARL